MEMLAHHIPHHIPFDPFHPSFEAPVQILRGLINIAIADSNVLNILSSIFGR